MNNHVRQQLRQLINERGRALCNDYRLCENFLRDICPYEQREVNLLVQALKGRVVADLLMLSPNSPLALEFPRLTKRLCDNQSLAEDAAQWAVESWALALGIISSEVYSVSRVERPSLSEEVPLARGSSIKAQPSSEIFPQRPIIVSKDGTGHYTAISEAIKYAPPNATILVRPGTYYEELLIDLIFVQISGKDLAQGKDLPKEG